MESAASALTTVRQIIKYYDQCLDVVRQRYGMTKLEAVIISFLHNNPGHDTVGEIAELRMLSKGNVSRSADALIRRGLVERIPDQEDRRWVHLHLKPEADPIVEDIEAALKTFSRHAFAGFTPEDMEVFHDLNMRLAHNVGQNLERSTCLHGEQK